MTIHCSIGPGMLAYSVRQVYVLGRADLGGCWESRDWTGSCLASSWCYACAESARRQEPVVVWKQEKQTKCTSKFPVLICHEKCMLPGGGRGQDLTRVNMLSNNGSKCSTIRQSETIFLLIIKIFVQSINGRQKIILASVRRFAWQ